VTGEVVLVAAAYLMGSLPTALLVVWVIAGKDVRRLGSGNIGATNATRAAGLQVGIVVTLVDAGKGALSVWLMTIFDPTSGWIAAAMLAAVLGHCFPVWLRFRGGKGVATLFGALLVLMPSSTLVAAGVWLVVLVLWRYVSLASLLATAVVPVLVAFIDRPPGVLQGAVVAAAVLVILRHRDNLRKLTEGVEPKIGRRQGGDE
jgi:acyl phosphate:glycerol-3-phosphate acyltransferase